MNAEVHERLARRAENAARTIRLRRDWYTRAALQHYLSHCSPMYCDVRTLLEPYDYLDSVPPADFGWAGGIPAGEVRETC